MLLVPLGGISLGHICFKARKYEEQPKMSTNRENLSYPELFPTIERFLDSDKLRLRFFVPPGFGKTTTTGKLIVTRREYKYLVVELHIDK